MTVSATAVSPAVADDFTLSTNKTLTITAGQTTSTGTVTITANNNDADTPDNTVRVSGTVTNSAGVTAPSDVTLTIIDEDDPPTVTLELMPTSIDGERRVHHRDGKAEPHVERDDDGDHIRHGRLSGRVGGLQAELEQDADDHGGSDHQHGGP